MKISTVLIFTSLWIFLVNIAMLNSSHAATPSSSPASLSAPANFLSKTQASYKVEIIKQKNRAVALDPSFGVTEFSFTEMKKKVTLPFNGRNEVSYLTDTRAAYRSKSLSNIESVAIVQWIQGCQYESALENKVVTKSFSISRDHFGKIIPFQHLGWEIDSDSEDPIYSSFGEFGRHALLRWNIDGESLDPETAIYYADKKPEVLRVFVTDMPGSAFTATHENKGIKRIEAKNTSLEFKTCLFKMSDLPIKTDPKGTNIPQEKALACFKWDHKFVYDFKSAKFNSTGPIDPFCKIK